LITPFTPPECLTGEECPASDIWRFGMSLLAVLTRETPYAECKTPIELFMKIKNYELPEALLRVEDPAAVELIKACLDQVARRWKPGQLLAHLYFTRDFSQDQERVAEPASIVVIFKSQATSASRETPPSEGLDSMVGVRDSPAGGASVPRLVPKIERPP
jgi:hypothetical protein